MVFEKDKVKEIVDEDGSDSAIVDNALEFLSLAMEPERLCYADDSRTMVI